MGRIVELSECSDPNCPSQNRTHRHRVLEDGKEEPMASRGCDPLRPQMGVVERWEDGVASAPAGPEAIYRRTGTYQERKYQSTREQLSREIGTRIRALFVVQFAVFVFMEATRSISGFAWFAVWSLLFFATGVLFQYVTVRLLKPPK